LEAISDPIRPRSSREENELKVHFLVEKWESLSVRLPAGAKERCQPSLFSFVVLVDGLHVVGAGIPYCVVDVEMGDHRLAVLRIEDIFVDHISKFTGQLREQ
jgi:hypothetical protein